MGNTWLDFPVFFWVSISCWLLGVVFLSISYLQKQLLWPGLILIIFGWLGVLLFDGFLWMDLERPPMRTLGETRLWYSTFLPLIGLVTFFRWRYKWFLLYCIALSGMFLLINYLNPETYSKTLMPALQSVWFVPHVLVYLLAYAFLAASSLVALRSIFFGSYLEERVGPINLADNLVYLGFAFLTLGLLFGALWAKEAWGHYWTWDPKEIWALLTWMGYLVYIHLRYSKPKKRKLAYYILASAFIILLICWFGINYLPVAANSVHTYTQ